MRTSLVLVLFAIPLLSCDHDVGSHPPSGCTKASECSDFDPCTKDVCSSGVCHHDQIHGCNALTRGVVTPR